MAAQPGLPLMAGRAAPKAALVAAIGKGIALGVPAALIGIGLGYALLRAFDTRWDEFSTRAADGESTMTPRRRAR